MTVRPRRPRRRHLQAALVANLSAQAAIVASQFVVGAITGRLFEPSVFGGFAAALSLQAVLTMVSSTGTPSYVLMAPAFTAGDLRRLRRFSATSGILTAAVYVAVLPSWLSLLHVDTGVEFRWGLALTQLLSPMAALEVTLLRRGHRGVLDAAIVGTAAVCGLAVSGGAAAATHAPATLALAPLTSVIITLFAAALLGRHAGVVPPGVASKRLTEVAAYLAKISGLNGAHFALSQAPAWILAPVYGASTLGSYSRATALTTSASTSIGTAMTRAVQGYWREQGGAQEFGRSVLYALRVTSGVSFPLFATVAVIGPSFIHVWLGEGWDLAARLTVPLAIGGAFQVPYSVLSNAFEMRNQTHVVRNAQAAMVVWAAGAAAAAWLGADPTTTAALLAAIPALGLAGLLWASRKTPPAPRAAVAALASSALWAAVVAAGAYGGLLVIDAWTPGSSPTSYAARVAGGLLGGLAIALATTRLSPVAIVIRETRRLTADQRSSSDHPES